MKVNALGRSALVAAVAMADAYTEAEAPAHGMTNERPNVAWDVVSAGELGTDVYLDSVTAAGPHAA